MAQDECRRETHRMAGFISGDVGRRVGYLIGGTWSPETNSPDRSRVHSRGVAIDVMQAPTCIRMMKDLIAVESFAYPGTMPGECRKERLSRAVQPRTPSRAIVLATALEAADCLLIPADRARSRGATIYRSSTIYAETARYPSGPGVACATITARCRICHVHQGPRAQEPL
jgi:hypothetical protein